MKAPASEVVRQLGAAGLLEFVYSYEIEGNGIRGRIGLVAVAILRRESNLPDTIGTYNKKWATGDLWQLHRDVGDHLVDFRSYRGTFGKGSLQVVIDRVTGQFWADVDVWNPYQDVVNFMGHAFGEVVPNWLRKWRRPA